MMSYQDTNLGISEPVYREVEERGRLDRGLAVAAPVR